MFSRGGAECVTCTEQAGLPFFAPAPSEFGGGGRLASAVDAKEHDHVRLGEGGRGDSLAAERADDAFSRGFGGGGFAQGSF